MWIERTLLIAVSLALLCGQTIDTAELKFREAVHKEQVEGDLRAAIKLYQSVADGDNRVLAAKALVSLGRCYEKQGSAEARKAYEKVLRSFSDQNDASSAARARLAKLTITSKIIPEVTARRLSKPISPFAGQIRTVSRDGAYSTYVYNRRSIPVLVDLRTGSERDLGAGKKLLIPSGEMSGTAAISPDGLFVAYNRVRNDWTSEIHIIGVNSSEPRVLYRGPAAPHILDWSRDGSTLLVREVRAPADRRLRWLLINVKTGEVKEPNLPVGPLGTGLFTDSEQLQMQAGLSPDAKFIAYTELNDVSEPAVYLAATAGSSRRLTATGVSAYFFGWSPNGKSLLYISDQSGSHDLWAVDINNGSPVGIPKLIKKDIGRVFGSGIADDGSLYYSASVNTGSVYLGDLDVETATVSNMHELPQPRGIRNLSASWSPDGSKLLLHRETSQRSLINVIHDVSTGREHELTIPHEVAFNEDRTDRIVERSYRADWTTDPHTMLLATANLKGPTQIRIIDVKTGEVKLRKDTSETARSYSVVTPSPDGVHVFAVAGRNMSNDSRIVRINMKTGEENDVCPARPMVWAVSPDGRYVVCGGYGDSLRVVPASGGPARDLVKGGMFSAMAWTPDGKSLIYTTVERGALTSATYWIAPLDGGYPRKLAVPLDRLGLLNIHPNGRRIAITSYGAWTEIWVLQNLNTSGSTPPLR